MTVSYDAEQTDLAAIDRRVRESGYRLAPAPGTVPAEMALTGWRRLFTGRERQQLLLGGLFLVAGGLLDLTGFPSWVARSGFALAILVAGLPVARQGWRTLRTSHRLDINLLMTIAILGASLSGDWLEAATVAVLFSLGEVLEGASAERARRSIRSLMELAPPDALVRRAGGEVRVPLGEVAVGDLIVIRPGDRVPLDGIITHGDSSLNEAPVTGESLPVEKGPGAVVYAGTINGFGALEVETSHTASDSTIARIIRLVEEAQERKAPTQRFVDVFATYYTPAVVLLAILVAVAPPLLLNGSWWSWLYRALVLLVVACPCALVISTPVTIVSALAAAARRGVLIKGGAALEAAAGLQALAFDKTGTLTLGTPVVTQVISLDGRSEEELLRDAAALERYSEHPLGAAIVRAATDRAIDVAQLPVTEVQSLAGHGVEGWLGATRLRVGTRRLVLDGAADLDVEGQLAALEADGQTAVLVGIGERVAGIIALSDERRPEAAAALRAIKKAGIRETVMLTGDRRAVAESVAAAIGVDQVEAELLPQDKVAAIERLLARYGAVGMVGDGINDAPALATATVGIAMGAVGSDTALETADIALMSDDLSQLSGALQLSRRTKRVIAQNIALALGLKLLFLLLAIGGVATLWEAVFADVGVSLLVTANGLRLLRRPASEREGKA